MARSVLVVDDDSSFRQLVVGLLRLWGHEVAGEAGSVAEAVDAMTALRPDTVLIDIGLPDGDGLELAMQMSALPWKPKILLISADADAASDSDARRAGAAGFTPKAELTGSHFRRMLDG
jgi:CheY-like chemotaxis protein